MTALIVDLNNNSRPPKEIRPAATPADVAELRRPRLAIGVAHLRPDCGCRFRLG